MLIFFPIYSMVKIFRVLNFHPSRLQMKNFNSELSHTTVINVD